MLGSVPSDYSSKGINNLVCSVASISTMPSWPNWGSFLFVFNLDAVDARSVCYHQLPHCWVKSIVPSQPLLTSPWPNWYGSLSWSFPQTLWQQYPNIFWLISIFPKLKTKQNSTINYYSVPCFRSDQRQTGRPRWREQMWLRCMLRVCKQDVGGI